MYSTWSEAIEAYENWLGESGPVVIGTLEYAPATVLRAVDPIAFRCGFFDFLDAEGIDSDDLEGYERP